MLRKLLVLLVVPLALVACEDDPDVVVTDDDADVVEEETEVPETPLEVIDECSEVSATEGAPAGVTMMDSFFEPACIAVSSTQQITLTNAGNLEHNFSVGDDGDFDIDVDPGGEATTDEVGTDLAAGTYRFYCEYHEEEGMVGTLVVE